MRRRSIFQVFTGIKYGRIWRQISTERAGQAQKCATGNSNNNLVTTFYRWRITKKDTQSMRMASTRVSFASGDGGIRTHVPVARQLDFESFPPCDFWWKLSEDGSTQRKPKSCGILRILASVFRFYLNPQGFPSSSHFCPELWPEDRTRIELDARLGVFTPIPFHENANHHFD